MNILEYYIKKYNNIKILFTGIDSDKLNEIGSILAKDLSLPLIKIEDLIGNYYFNLKDIIDNKKIEEAINNNKSFIMVGFLNPIDNIKFDFIFNIKFDNKIFIDKNINNSKLLYELYKTNLKNSKIDKFFKYEEMNNLVDNLFNTIMELISKKIYNENTIFKKIKSDKSGQKKNYNFDKDNLYVDIDNYNDKMHNLKIYDDNDNDIYEEMNNSSFSNDEKIYFVQDFFYKNFKGGNKKNYLNGKRYID